MSETLTIAGEYYSPIVVSIKIMKKIEKDIVY